LKALCLKRLKVWLYILFSIVKRGKIVKGFKLVADFRIAAEMAKL
jgi:hypothetical protein